MTILRVRRGHTEVITLNRPEAANSLNAELMAELGAALVEILDDVDARSVVLTGAGERVFCAGMDLGSLGEVGADDVSGSPAGDALGSLLAGTFPKPLIAAVNGAAVGAGLELVMACDLVVAAEHARFGLPEVKRGLFSAAGGTLLSTRIPLVLALEMGLTGRPFDADQALGAGLINRMVPADEVLPTAVELAEEIAANGPIAVRLTKALMRAAVTEGPHGARATPEQVSSVFDSNDAQEGAASFFEKRPARFTGT